MKRLLEEELFKWKTREDRKPLILKGARQVGKSFLLKTFGGEHFKNMHYIDFEKESSLHSIFEGPLSARVILDQLQLYLNALIVPHTDVLIFDEIQACPRALTSLKYLYEECPELAVLSAGSLIGIHLNPESFPVGKVEFMSLYPMTFEEFLLGIQDLKALEYLKNLVSITSFAHAHLLGQFKEYMISGGLPECVSTYATHIHSNKLNTYRIIRQKQSDLITAYIADMAKHSGKENAMHIHRVWVSVVAQLSQNQDGALSKYQFKNVLPGKSRYAQLAGPLDWLISAGLIIKIPIIHTAKQPLQAYTSENFFKLALFDIGILGAMAQLDPAAILAADYGTYKGFFVENLIAQELIASGVNSLFSWQENTAEVEFLANIGSNVVGIEVKSGSHTQSKSLSIFSKKYPEHHPMILSAILSLSISSTRSRYPLYVAGQLNGYEVASSHDAN